MIDFDAFTKLEGTVWAKEPELWLQPEARLVWWLAEHLAARCEMHVDPEDMAQADPGSLYFLKLAEEYLLALQTPRPQALAWFLCRVTGKAPRGAV